MKVSTPLLFGLIILLILSGCASSGIQSRVYLKSGADVSDLKRYTWAKKDSLSFLGVFYGGDHKALSARLKKITKEALSIQGYQYVDASDNPQFLVSLVGGVMEQEKQSEHNYKPSTLSTTSISWSQTNSFYRGGISLVFHDLSGENIIWQSTATRTIKSRELANTDGSVMLELFETIKPTLPLKSR